MLFSVPTKNRYAYDFYQTWKKVLTMSKDTLDEATPGADVISKEEPVKMQPAARDDAAESLANPDYNRLKLYKKGVNLMADEKLEDACEVFEQALRIDPDSVDTLLKLGYARFHLDQYADALKAYDRVLDIDVTHPEAWNLKSLVDYEQKNYSKALDAVENAVESDPNYGMAWYNKACYLSLLNQVPDALEALKRSIEVDVKNARKAVKDRDFINVRIEEGFRRIIEVVVLESIRQGYHTLGAIVWTTFLSKADTEEALVKLLEKGLITKHEKREGFHRIPTYDLAKTLADRVTREKKGFLGLTRKKMTGSVLIYRMLSEAVHAAKTSVEEENVQSTISNLEIFIDPKKCGPVMIEQFFEEHRDIRLWKVRMEHRGQEYLLEHKERILSTLDNISVTVTRRLRDDYSADKSQ